jgi:hypothetical protein
MAADPPVVVKYVDGIKQHDWTANQGLDNPRRALQPTAVLFGDGDQDERRAMFVNSIQIREGRLSDAQLALLGGAEAAGIPLVLPPIRSLLPRLPIQLVWGCLPRLTSSITLRLRVARGSVKTTLIFSASSCSL